MSENLSTSRHVSYEQVKAMMDFMGQNIDLATGSLRTLEARHLSKKLWGELTKILNNCKSGTRKTSNGWSRYWSDFKNKLKNKVRLLKKKKRSNSTSGKVVRPLTKMEKRALVILGPHFEKKITTNTVDGYSNSDSNHVPPCQIKLEAFQENVPEFCSAQSETSDRVSEDGDSQSAESNEEEGIEVDLNSMDALQNITPKWLIEVEKKRADAELIRAKAEQQRVSVAAKSADAALQQAEALHKLSEAVKKLSEAATVQADAIMRVAVVLESRGHREDLLSM